MYIKFYQNRQDFVEDVTNTFWCVFRFTVYWIFSPVFFQKKLNYVTKAY